jgi:2,4-dienoyl-CoA reductase-like NADH-dependent reductase (Old Yellow Enzyme family)
LSNTRNDCYGGSFENRTRMLSEVVQATRQTWPADLPLFARISAIRIVRLFSPRLRRHTPDNGWQSAFLVTDAGVIVFDAPESYGLLRRQVKFTN